MEGAGGEECSAMKKESEKRVAHYFLDGLVDPYEPEAVDQALARGELIPFAEIEPDQLEGGEVLARVMTDYIAHVEARLAELRKLPRPGEIGECENYGYELDQIVQRTLQMMQERRGISFEEYRKFLSFTPEELYEVGVPMTWAEYQQTYARSSPPDPPAKPDKSLYYREGRLRSEVYARDTHRYQVDLERYRRRRDEIRREDQARMDALRAAYQQYKRGHNVRRLNPAFSALPGFAFLRDQVKFESFLTDNDDSLNGYRLFLKTLTGPLPFLRWIYERTFCLLPVAALQGHTYLTGATRSGKTELLKFIIHQLQKSPRPKVPRSLVIMEPEVISPRNWLRIRTS